VALVPVFPLVHNATYEYAQPTNYQTPEVLVGGGFYAQKTTTSLTAPTTTTGITYDGTNTFLVVETEGTKISFQIGGAEYAWLDNAGTLHANTLAAVNYFYSPNHDTAAAGALTIGGTNATSIAIGKAGVTVNAPGTLQMAGATVVYGDSNGVGSLNTAPSVGGVGANAIPRSCFYRDNNEQFGALGVNIQHPTASGYQAQFACLGYDGITWMARAKQSGTWGGTTYLFGTGNYNSGCHQPSSSPWITPALISPWTNYGGGWPPFGYYKDPTGRVYVRGAICGGSVNTDCYQLVAGYRPGYAQSFPINCGSNAFGTAVVYANGNIAIAPPTNTAYLDLSTISFYADG